MSSCSYVVHMACSKKSLPSVRRVCDGGKLTVAGKVPRMSCRTQDPLPGSAGLPYERDLAKVPGTPHRDNRRTSRPNKRSDNGAVQRLLGEVLLLCMRPLREEDMLRLQGCSYGHSAS